MKAIDALIQQQKLKEAELEVRTAVNDHPQNFELRRQLVIVYALQGKYIDATQHINRIEDEFVNVRLFEAIIESYYMLGEYEEVLTLSEKSEALLNENVSRPVLSAIALAELYFNQSDQILTDLISNLEPINDEYQDFLPLLQDFYTSKDATKFIDGIQRAPNIKEANELDWLLSSFLANLYFNNSEHSRSLPYFESYLSQRSEYHIARAYKASALISAGEIEKADTLLQSMLARFPTNPIINQLNAAVRLDKGEIPEGIISLDIAVNGGLTSKFNFLMLGLMHFEEGNYERAINFLERGGAGTPTASNYHSRVLNYARLFNRDVSAVDLQPSQISNLDEIREVAKRLTSVGDIEGFANLQDAITLDENSNPLTEFEYALSFIAFDSADSANTSLYRLAKNLLADPRYLKVANNGSINAAKLFVLSNEIKQDQAQALAYLNEWKSNNPNDAFNFVLESEFYSNIGDNQKALSILKENATADSPLYFRTLAKAHYQLGQFNEAVEASKSALELNPFSDELIKSLVVAETSAGENASEFIDNLYVNNTRNITTGLFKSKYYAYKGDFKKSLDAIETNYLAVDARLLSELYLMRSRANFILGNHDEARVISEEFINMNVPLEKTTEVIEHFKIIQNHITLQAFLDKQLKAFPKSEGIKQELVFALWQNKETDRLIDLIETMPSTQQNSIILANSLLIEGKVSPAMDLMKTTHESYNSAESAMAYSDFLKKIGDEANSLKVLTDTLSIYPESHSLRLYYATQLPHEGAIEQYLMILDDNPNHFMALANIAYSYSQVGDKDKAIRYIDRALQISPENGDVVAFKKQLETSM